eukprot:2949830-Alexandrium_andersonii.AAC.1
MGSLRLRAPVDRTALRLGHHPPAASDFEAFDEEIAEKMHLRVPEGLRTCGDLSGNALLSQTVRTSAS